MSITQEEHFKFYKLTRYADSLIIRVGKNTGTCYTYRSDTNTSYAYGSRNHRWCGEDTLLDIDNTDIDNPKATWKDDVWDIEELPFDIATEEAKEE